MFVTHSIPTAMAETAGPVPRSGRGAYVDWHAAVASEVAQRVGERRGRSFDSDLVYCSRSGPASQPWLEPDINDHLRQLAGRGVRAVVVVPIGFVSDHMEVVFDLDTEAAATAEECGMAFAARVPPAIIRRSCEGRRPHGGACRGRPRGAADASQWWDRLRSAGMSVKPTAVRTSGTSAVGPCVKRLARPLRDAWFWRSLAVPARATDRWAQTTLRSGNFRHVARYSGREHT